MSVVLSGCLAPALLMPAQSRLMWALLKPLVGFDPNEVRLFEQPMVKQRMTALLGPHYDTTMALLRTADELRQEGPLFYVVSRYTPVPELAGKAGLVWNSGTNQMAVALLKGDVAEVFAETVKSSVDKVTDQARQAVEDKVDETVAEAQVAAGEQLGVELPVWPEEMRAWVNPRDALQDRVDQSVESAIGD